MAMKAMVVKAFFLNFTLKKSPHVPSAQAPADMSTAIFKEPDFESEETTVIDRNSASGISDVGKGGEDFPEKIKTCNIPVIAAPDLYGTLPSITKMAIKRQERTYMEGHTRIGQYPLMGRLQDLLSRELKAAHTMYSISNITGHMLQSDISPLFKENLIRINLEDLLRKQRRQANEVIQPECRNLFCNNF